MGVDEERAKAILEREDIEYRVELGLGREQARYWTCDYSYVCLFFELFYQGEKEG